MSLFLYELFPQLSEEIVDQWESDNWCSTVLGTQMLTRFANTKNGMKSTKLEAMTQNHFLLLAGCLLGFYNSVYGM